MQEVFSKIIERLETERLKREEQLKTCNDSDAEDYFRCKMSGIADAIEIVKQAAAEYKHGHYGCNSNGEHEKCFLCGDYDCKNRNRTWFGAEDDNNGWIPVSERLPEGLRPYQIQEYPVTMRAVKGKLKGKPFTSHANFDNAYGKWMVKEKAYEVLAWKEPDKPYQPKGE